MHVKKVFYTKLDNCPENQLRKNDHPFDYFDYEAGVNRKIKQADAGWDLAAAEDILIKPYGTIYAQGNLFQNIKEVENIELTLNGVTANYERYKYDLQLIRTGITIRPSYLGFFDIRPRSGFSGKYGLGIVNSPGTVDAPYTGELCVIAYSLLPFKPIPIKRGEFVAQLIPMHQLQVVFVEASPEDSEVNIESRGAKGFGSSEEQIKN